MRIQRLRSTGGRPLVLEDSWLPAERFPGLLERDLSGSVYALMRDCLRLGARAGRRSGSSAVAAGAARRRRSACAPARRCCSWSAGARGGRARWSGARDLHRGAFVVERR